MKLADYFAPLDDEVSIVEYVADEPVCYACRHNRHEFCLEKKGLECWCDEEDAHDR